jgi:hypothetical protein
MRATDRTPLDDRVFGDGVGDSPNVREAYENLRMIREVMERSTKHSTLSGFSGIITGLWAIIGVSTTRWLLLPELGHEPYATLLTGLGATWVAVLALSVATDFVATKSRAVRVGKVVFSQLGAHMAGAAAPGFAAGLALTLYFVGRGQIDAVWPYWMLCYGMAICAVGQFSVRPVSYLGWAFVLAGAATLFVPHALGIWMIALSFGGFHIAYGLYTGITRRDW